MALNAKNILTVAAIAIAAVAVAKRTPGLQQFVA